MPQKIPSLSALRENYPYPDKRPRDSLYRDLGWDDLIDKEGYENTCAVRMSLCLTKCGMSLPQISASALKIKKGKLTGKWLEVNRERLANYLKQRDVWGDPIVETSSAKMRKQIGIGGGVISFGPLPGYRGGHIDVATGSGPAESMLLGALVGANLTSLIANLGLESTVTCGSHCYWDASEFWFWRTR